MLDLILLCGRVTSSWYAELALRRRVKKSAMGSVIVMTAGSPSSRRFPRVISRAYRAFYLVVVGRLLPAGLLDTGQFAGMCHLPQADPAQAELAEHGVRTA